MYALQTLVRSVNSASARMANDISLRGIGTRLYHLYLSDGEGLVGLCSSFLLR